MRRLHLLLLLMATLSATAGTYNYLTVVTDALESSIALTSVKKITFSGSNLIVTTMNGEENSFELSTFNRLTFTEEATAVRPIAQEGITFRNGRIVASGAGVLTIYNASGAVVRQQYVGDSRSELNIATLPHGIYIAKLGRQTIKISK